jgi:hypothetical protein
MGDYIYGKGGKTKGKRRITCDVCAARRYVDPASFSAGARYVCGRCWQDCSEQIPQPSYEAHLMVTLVQPGDLWRPEWYSYRFVPVGTIDDFFVASVGWENLQSVERARFLVGLTERLHQE